LLAHDGRVESVMRPIVVTASCDYSRWLRRQNCSAQSGCSSCHLGQRDESCARR